MADIVPRTIGDDPGLRDFVLRSALQVLDDAKRSGCQHPRITGVFVWPGSEQARTGRFYHGVCSLCTAGISAKSFVFPQLTNPEE